MKRLAILLTALIAAPAFANGIIVDLGDNGGYTGYARQVEPLPGNAQKILEYHWVCPYGAIHPAGGLVTVQPIDDELSPQTITLSKYQCCQVTSFDWEGNPESCQIVNMVKRYNRAYYVVGGKKSQLPQGQADHGGSGAAAAAKAAGAAAGGYYNSCSSNPFSFCAGPEPGPDNPLRGCWTSICPIGR